MVTLMFVLASLVAQQDDVRGPIETHSPTIFQLSSTDLIPTVPLSLKEGEARFSLAADWANTFTATKYVVDAEILHVRPTLWYGVTEKVTIGVSLPVNFVGGGRMDNLIDSVHHGLGMENERTNYSRNEFQAVLPSGTHHYRSRALVGDLLLQSQYKLVEDQHYGLLLGAQLQLPTGVNTSWFQHDTPGIGGYLAGFYDIGDFRVFAAAGFASVGDTTIFEQRLRPWQTSIIYGADFKVSDELSFIAQMAHISGPAQFDQYARWSIEVVFGARYQWSDHVAVELAATENLFFYDNSADFGMHFGVVIR